MIASDVVDVLDRLDAASVWYCVEGGWGVDALLGDQTRAHDDLDLAVSMDEVDRICAALPEFERTGKEWPASFVLRDRRGRVVDCHPLVFDESGDGWQANLHGDPYRWPFQHLGARGRIGGREVRCISPELQVRWRAYDGYDDIDWKDVRALCQRFGIAAPPALERRSGLIAAKRPRNG